MTDFFITVLNMSLSASLVILVIILFRLVLRKAPKKWSYILWSAAFFRLCCPVSLRSVVSLFRFAPSSAVKSGSEIAGSIEYFRVSANPGASAPVTSAPVVPAIQSPSPALQTAEPAAGISAPSIAAPAASPDILRILLTAGTVLFLLGMAAMLIYGLAGYIRMHRKLVGAMLMKQANDENRASVYMSDEVTSPFILGVFRPRIYIPFALDGDRLDYVLAHENYHLKRKDHLVKFFAFILLAVHWFNPLCWLAFFLMSKDMEMSCDEAVLNKGVNAQKAYCETLLGFAVSKHAPMPNPLAFGESAVRSRIKNAMRYKKPKLAVTMISLILCAFVIAACALNPAETENPSGAPDQNMPAETGKEAENTETSRPDDEPVTAEPDSSANLPKMPDKDWFIDTAWTLAQEVCDTYGVTVPKEGDPRLQFQPYPEIGRCMIDFGTKYDEHTPVTLLIGFNTDDSAENGWRINDCGLYVDMTFPGPENYDSDRAAFDGMSLYLPYGGNADPERAARLGAEEFLKLFTEWDSCFHCSDGGVIDVALDESRNYETQQTYIARLALKPVNYGFLPYGFEDFTCGIMLDPAYPEYRLYGIMEVEIPVVLGEGGYTAYIDLPEWNITDEIDSPYHLTEIVGYGCDYTFAGVPGVTYGASFSLPADYSVRMGSGSQLGETHMPLYVEGEHGGYIFNADGKVIGAFQVSNYDPTLPQTPEAILAGLRTGHWHIMTDELYEPVSTHATCHSALTLAEGVEYVDGLSMAAMERFSCDALVAYDTETHLIVEIVFDRGLLTHEQLAWLASQISTEITTMGDGFND